MSFHMFPAPENKRPFSWKLALFDVDGTLIVSKSGLRWATSKEDWIWSNPSVPGMLNTLYCEGWTIAMISNQAEWQLSSGPHDKLQSILNAIDLLYAWRPWCLVATSKSKEKDTVYRKPGRGLFDKLLEAMKVSKKDITALQMCGDACGEMDENPAYRWADSDRKFAEGISATFVRPCDLFPPCIIEPHAAQEIVLLMGNPGSGKSMTGRLLESAGYTHLEQDIIGTKEKVLKAAKQALLIKSSVVVDATHGSAKNREPYLELSKKYKIPLRIIWHLRDGRPFNDLRDKPVPAVAYAVYTKYFVDPRTDDVKIEFA